MASIIQNFTEEEMDKLRATDLEDIKIEDIKLQINKRTKERIEALLLKNDISSNKTLATCLGVKESTASRYLRNCKAFKNKTLRNIAERFDVSYNYLKYGINEPIKNSVISTNIKEILSSNEKNLLNNKTRVQDICTSQDLIHKLQYCGCNVSATFYSLCINGKKEFPQYCLVYIARLLKTSYNELLVEKKN